jgi:hypothetical protein
MNSRGTCVCLTTRCARGLTGVCCSVRLGVRLRSDFEIVFTLPQSFPNDPPVVELPAQCSAVFDANECSIFAIVEAIREQLQEKENEDELIANNDNDVVSVSVSVVQADDDDDVTASSLNRRTFQFTQSELITDRKSKFRAYAAWTESVGDARAFVSFLDSVDRRVGDATHRMLVWKTAGTCGRDDDGETGAGDRVLFLLDRLNLDNVAVCIVRWYGGIQLGADRFKHISNAAREALTALSSSATSSSKQKR